MDDEPPLQLELFGDTRPRPADPTADRNGAMRHPDHSTSVAAALASPGRRTSQRVRLGQQFYDQYPEGLTDDEAALLAGVEVGSSPWKRCGELRDAGYLEETGETRPTRMGAEAKVWRMTVRGRGWWKIYVLDPAG